MTNIEAKKYCIDVIGMSEKDFSKPTNEDLELNGVTEDSFINVFSYETECGTEYEGTTALEIAKEHKYWSNPDNVDAYIDFMQNEI